MTITPLRVLCNSLSKKVLIAFSLILAPAFAMAAADVVEPPQEFNPSLWDWSTLLTLALMLLVILVIARAFDIGSLTEKISANAW